MITTVVSRITQELAVLESLEIKLHSLLELEGLGADIWKKVDIDEYISNLRAEWDEA